MAIIDFRHAAERLKDFGFRLRPERVYIQISDAKVNLQNGLRFFIGAHQWLPEYEEIVSWLTNNHGRGLLCIGHPGRGKTIICTKIIPPIIIDSCNLITNIYDATDLNNLIDKILKNRIVCIDDIGTEGEYVKYGEHRVPFAELVDLVEKKGTLLILTTNLTVDELRVKYGERVVDRLRAITNVIYFKGCSLRK